VLVTGAVTAQGWLVAGGLAISGVGVLVAVLGIRRDGSFYAGSQERLTPVDNFATYASPLGGSADPAQPGPCGCGRARCDDEERDQMATEGTRQEFDQIVERLTTDYPALGRPAGLPWSPRVRIAVAVAGSVVWGLLSVAMVAWGWRGLVLTGAVAAVAAAVAALDIRRRSRP
jgi:hypothetical protein